MKIPIIIRGHISQVDKMLFTKHLSVILKSGISLGEAIQIVSEQATNPTIRRLTNAIKKDIDNGKTLATALSAHPTVFDPLYIRFIIVGEESGSLQKNLEYLAAQLKKNFAFQKKIKGAMIYPAIVLSAAGIAGVGISLFVLPQLVTLFDSLDVTLPFSTKVLIFFANLMKGYGFLIVGTMAAMLIIFRYITQMPQLQPHWHAFLLKLPIFGSFLRNVELALFCRNIGMMLQSGMPINAVLRAQSQATSNKVFQSYVEQLQIGVEKGKSLEDTFLTGHFPYMPALVGRMIGVGEKTGKLEESLLYLSEFYEDEVDESSRNLAAALEPLVLLVVGVIVAFVAFAIITPIYQFTGSVKR